MEDISRRLEALRIERGLEVTELSRLSKLNAEVIVDIELGDITPSFKMVSVLCEAMKVDFQKTIKNTIVEWNLLSSKFKLDTPTRRKKL